jgi:hypothetical protein
MTLLEGRPALATAVALALLAPSGVVIAQKQILQDRPVTMETLLDRVQIEDFITGYYYDLSVGKAKELLFTRPEGASAPAATAQRRRGNMMLTNPIINVEAISRPPTSSGPGCRPASTPPGSRASIAKNASIAEKPRDHQYFSAGRISTAPPSRAAGIRAASAIAASTVSASYTA